MSKVPQVFVVLGSQWGDEGKGKLVDLISQDYDICARCQGGSNAGHTVVVNNIPYAFNLLPSGILNEKTTCLIGNGVVLHLPRFFEEIETIEKRNIRTSGRILVSDRSHLIFDAHQIFDKLLEAEKAKEGAKIGTTGKGIGPAYSLKALRHNLRVCDLRDFHRFEEQLPKIVAELQRQINFPYDIDAELIKYREFAKKLEPYIVDSVHYLSEAHRNGKRILIEGANACLLDIDFGTYPYVTSSNASIGGCITGLGISPNKLNLVAGVVKAYTTRVGEGPFPTEMNPELSTKIRTIGKEFGVVSGRPRRIGWMDTVVLKYSQIINGFNCVNITKLDILTGLPELRIGVAYVVDGKRLDSFPASLDTLSKATVEYETFQGWNEDLSKARKFEELPLNARKYVLRIEELMGTRARWIGVGAGREAMIDRDA